MIDLLVLTLIGLPVEEYLILLNSSSLLPYQHLVFSTLLLVNSPFANQVEEKRVAGNYIRVIADSYGVPLLEGNYLVDEMEIDFEKDLLDASHLNYFGSVKYTKYLAEWMQEHCQLPDRRGNVDYWEWEEVSDLFWEVKEEALAGELSASFCVQAQSYAG